MVGNAFSGFGLDLLYADGLLYSTSGRVIDAASRSLPGSFAASGPVAADSDTGIVYFLEGSGTARQLKLFDMNTFVPLDTITIDGVLGTAGSLILLEDHALAFRTSESQLFVVNTVPLPAAAWMLLTVAPLLALRARRGCDRIPGTDG